MVQHLRCMRIRESELEFDSHMSGFVYKVRVHGRTLIKKEIPGPDTVDEFLYEVNALNSLKFSKNVIPFYGVVVDDDDKNVKGLLIDYAEQGALIDVIYDSQEHDLDLPWSTREKWARQIVQGLSDIHESGFVQGDFTLSNIVIDDDKNAKIIDINRRGCPVGWEPPEATPLIDSNQRISMYIGVKSDLYQLGMVLWALATLEDEPEAHARPLRLAPDINVPVWYRRMVESCLDENPRFRPQASMLVSNFPELPYEDPPSISVDDGYSVQQYVVDGYERNGHPLIRTVTPQSEWNFSGGGHGSGLTSPGLSDDAFYYPPRGRSPPSPLPSNHDECDTPYISRNVLWSVNDVGPPSVSDYAPDGSVAESLQADSTGATPVGTERSGNVLQVVDPQDPAVNGHDTTVTSSQAVGSLSTGGPTVAPRIVVEEVAISPAHDETNHAILDDDPTPTGKLSEPQGSVSVEFKSEDAPVSEEHTGRTEPASEAGKGPVAAGGVSTPAPVVPGRQDDSQTETDSGPNYVHGAASAPHIPPREIEHTPTPQTQVQERPSHEFPSELTGIGSAHGAPDDIPQEMFSDEDLGLTTTVSQNVTSQA
jgi:serine/threonine protein kinase